MKLEEALGRIRPASKETMDAAKERWDNIAMPLHSLGRLQDTIVRGIEILDITKPDTQRLNDNKRWLVSQDYTVTSFDSALYYLPPIEVLVNEQTYQSNPLALKVYSVPVDTLHPEQIFGPKSVREISLRWSDIAALVYSALLMVLLGVIVVFLILRYRDNKPIIKINSLIKTVVIVILRIRAC